MKKLLTVEVKIYLYNRRTLTRDTHTVKAAILGICFKTQMMTVKPLDGEVDDELYIASSSYDIPTKAFFDKYSIEANQPDFTVPAPKLVFSQLGAAVAGKK